MSEFRKYQRKPQLSELRPYRPGEDLSGVSVADTDRQEIAEASLSGTGGGMIARNPDNHSDQWYIRRDYFEANFETEPVA